MVICLGQGPLGPNSRTDIAPLLLSPVEGRAGFSHESRLLESSRPVTRCLLGSPSFRSLRQRRRLPCSAERRALLYLRPPERRALLLCLCLSVLSDPRTPPLLIAESLYARALCPCSCLSSGRACLLGRRWVPHLLHIAPTRRTQPPLANMVRPSGRALALLCLSPHGDDS
jgi:hypothetical protein